MDLAASMHELRFLVKSLAGKVGCMTLQIAQFQEYISRMSLIQQTGLQRPAEPSCQIVNDSRHVAEDQAEFSEVLWKSSDLQTGQISTPWVPVLGKVHAK